MVTLHLNPLRTVSFLGVPWWNGTQCPFYLRGLSLTRERSLRSWPCVESKRSLVVSGREWWFPLQECDSRDILSSVVQTRLWSSVFLGLLHITTVEWPTSTRSFLLFWLNGRGHFRLVVVLLDSTLVLSGSSTQTDKSVGPVMGQSLSSRVLTPSAEGLRVRWTNN